MKFQADVERLTVDEMLDMEDGTNRRRVEIMSKMLVNGDGKYIADVKGEKAAMKIVGKMTVKQLIDASKQISAGLEGEETIPKEK